MNTVCYDPIIRNAMPRANLFGGFLIGLCLVWVAGCPGNGAGTDQITDNGNENVNQNTNGSDNDNDSTGGDGVTPAAAKYYVTPTGDDSNPGTRDRPWRTIQKAADTLVAGETVYIMAGTYAERVVPRNSGSADKYIVYAANPGDTVTIDGAAIDVPEWAALFHIEGKDFLRVAGLRVTNAVSNPHNPGIWAENARHIVIEKNYVYRTNDSGIAAWNSQDVIVEGNEVEEACLAGWNECISIGTTDGFDVRDNRVHVSSKEGICAKDGSSNGRVYRNQVHHTEAVGIYVDAQDKHTFNIDVFDNVSHDGVEDGFAVASEVGGLLENVRVYNNVAYNNGWVGIDVSDCCIDSHPISNVLIVNNTLYNNGRDSWGGGIVVQNPQAQGIVIRNNICCQNHLFQIAVNAALLVDRVTVDHNLIDGFRGGEDEIYGDQHVEGTAGFADAGAADFHLLAISPAIDAGSPTDAPAADFDGHARPNGAACDIGAYERISP